MIVSIKFIHGWFGKNQKFMLCEMRKNCNPHFFAGIAFQRAMQCFNTFSYFYIAGYNRIIILYNVFPLAIWSILQEFWHSFQAGQNLHTHFEI